MVHIYRMFKKLLNFIRINRNKSPTLGINLRNGLNPLSFFYSGYKEKLLEIHSLIYAVVDRKSKAIAQLPLRLYKNDTVKENKCVFKRKIVVNNDISYIFDIAPNNNMTPYIFWRTVTAQKETYGNAYVYIKRNNIGEVVELNILDPSKVSIYLDELGEIYYKPYNDKNIYLHNLDILHFSSIYVSGYKGISFLECLRTQLNFKENVIKMNSEQMEKSIKAGATLKLPSNLSMDKMKEYKEQFEKSYSQGFNGLIVLDSGMIFEQIKYDVNDLKQSDINKITAKEVSSVSGLPLFMLGEGESSRYVNMEHQTIDFIQNCIAPEVVLIEQELNRKLLSEQQIKEGYYFKFNINALMRSDMSSRYKFYREMVSMGAMTLNEVRSLEDLESYGEIGERPVISLNYSYLDTLDKHQRINN